MLMKRAWPNRLSGSPLTAFGGAPPEGEHLGQASTLLARSEGPSAQPFLPPLPMPWTYFSMPVM